MDIIELADPAKLLATLDEPGEAWLCCHSCDRFFQLKSAQKGREVYCPFDDCYDYGLGLGIFLWDFCREEDDPRWPKSPEELSHGQRAPDPEPFYQEQLQSRVESLLALFHASPEKAELGEGDTTFLRPFFKMMSDLCWDITATSEAGFSADLVEIADDLPVWSQATEPSVAQRMAEEVVAFFRFAARTSAIQDAEAWLGYVLSDDLAERFRYTIKTDPRLRKLRASAKTLS